MKLFPVQQVVFKLVEGIPLDDTVKFPVRQICSFSRTRWAWEVAEYTEKSYVEMLRRDGQCIIPKQFSDPEWRARSPKTVCLVAGRRAGKNALTAELAAAELARRVVSHKNDNVASLLAVATDRDQAGLLLQGMFSAATRRPELKARLANATQSYFRFQTDEDIALDGTWEGSWRQARATAQIRAISSQAKGIRGSSLVFFCMNEPDHMPADQAEEVWLAGTPSLRATAGTAFVVGTPGVKGWLRKLFGQQDVLSLRIPTWEMNPAIPESVFEEACQRDPNTFWSEYGASWLEEVRGVRPVVNVHRSVTPADLEEEMRRKVRGEQDEHDQVINRYKGSLRFRKHPNPKYLVDYPVGMLHPRGGLVPYEAPPERTVDPDVLAGWLHEFGLAPKSTPSGALREIGLAHFAWQEKNFDGLNLLTQGLALSEECGEVSRAVLKKYLGIREKDRGDLSEELADIILVATAFAVRAGIDLDAALAKKAAARDLKDFRARPETG